MNTHDTKKIRYIENPIKKNEKWKKKKKNQKPRKWNPWQEIFMSVKIKCQIIFFPYMKYALEDKQYYRGCVCNMN